MAESESLQKWYIVRFKNNNSKHWDEKEVWLDATILDQLHSTSELFNGANITVPWKGKGGKITHWKAVFIDPSVKQKGNDNTCTYSIKIKYT